MPASPDTHLDCGVNQLRQLPAQLLVSSQTPRSGTWTQHRAGTRSTLLAFRSLKALHATHLDSTGSRTLGHPALTCWVYPGHHQGPDLQPDPQLPSQCLHAGEGKEEILPWHLESSLSARKANFHGPIPKNVTFSWGADEWTASKQQTGIAQDREESGGFRRVRDTVGCGDPRGLGQAVMPLRQEAGLTVPKIIWNKPFSPNGKPPSSSPAANISP